MKKSQKRELLKALEKKDILSAYKILLQAHKKGLGLVSSSQRFALSHEEALEFARNMEECFIDEKSLIIYPLQTKETIKDIIKNIYTKNKYALLSNSSIGLRLVWASETFIELALEELCNENILTKDGNLYKNSDIKEDIQDKLEVIILQRLKNEGITPTAPYNIYDELDIDRRLGDTIFKALTKKKLVTRIQHNLFIEAQILTNLITEMKNIIKQEGYIDIKNFKQKYTMSRKYMIAYLDYLDKMNNIENKDGKRHLLS